MSSSHSHRDTPRLGRNSDPGERDHDSFSVEGVRQFGFAAEFGELGAAFLEALRAIGGMGEGAEENYRRTLEGLRSYPHGEIVGLVRRGWEGLPEEAYLDRWGLVQLLTDLWLPDATEIFAAILATPVPPERSSEDEHRYSTVGEELVIRTTAVEGLARLAARGDVAAVDTLARHVGDDQRSIRAACVLALRELGGGVRVDLSGLVRPEDRDLLDVRRLDVRDVPRIENADHIRNPGAGTQLRPPAPG